MSNARSSRRKGVNVATFLPRDVIGTRSVLRQRESLDDRTSGAGPPASSLEGDVDLAEVTGFIVNNDIAKDAVPKCGADGVENDLHDEKSDFDEYSSDDVETENEDCVKDSYVNDENDNSFPNPSFSCDDFNMALVKTRNVRSQDAWSILLLGKSFQYKAMELEHDDELKRDNPSNEWKIFSIVTYDVVKRVFIPFSRRYTRKSLCFIAYSRDNPSDYDIFPVASFHPELHQSRKFFYLSTEDLFTQSNASSFSQSSPSVEAPVDACEQKSGDCNFMQGVQEEDSIYSLTSAQIGVLLTLVPPSKSFIMDQVVLGYMRKAMIKVLKDLNEKDKAEVEVNGISNILMALPYLFLQGSKDGLCRERSQMFCNVILDSQYQQIKVNSLLKKTLKQHEKIKRSFDFSSRCYREADKNVQQGDYSNAMRALQKINAKPNLGSVLKDIQDSLPARNVSMLTAEDRDELFTKVDAAHAASLVTASSILSQLRRLKRNRSPGVDGFTVEHLCSVFLGGNRDSQLKKDALEQYATFLRKFVVGELTTHQSQLFHAIKLAAIPKSESESRVIMMYGIHSKIVFSMFASSKLKRQVEIKNFHHQFGSKPSGAEAIIHMLQQVIIQSPDCDVFSADAVKAFYNLNRDLAMKKLKSECPEVFNLFMDKYNNSTNAFFHGLLQGVQRFSQTEGGSPGAPEMSFLYELGISEFIENVAQLIHAPPSRGSKKGLVAGYIDDFYWAATFPKMIEVIKFVLLRGPDYGYKLNMKKCVYLMAPSDHSLSDDELNDRVQLLMSLGLSASNIKIHPDCQRDVSCVVRDRRAAEWGFKVLGAFVGTDEFVVNALKQKSEALKELTDVMLRYPNVQARYQLHKSCYNAKVNYWLRSQFPVHAKDFIDDFQSLQVKLLASYHGLHDESDLTRAWPSFREVYDRAALPINKGGMELRSVKLVFLTAFACSLAASLKHLAKAFPDWINLDRDGSLLSVASDKSPYTSRQVEACVQECRRLFPEGPFGDDDDFSAILKTIAKVEVGEPANQRAAQLQSSPRQSNVDSLYDEVEIKRKRKTAQSALYDDLIKAQFKRLLLKAKAQANDARLPIDYRKVRYRNWVSSINDESGAWLSAGLSPKMFVMSNSEFVSAICRRNTFQNFSIPMYTSTLSRENPDLFVCSCDGGAHPKPVDPFGYHMVGCKIGANAIRLHDEVVCILAKLFRSLRVDAIVEPLRIFSDASPASANQRPDILLRNPRGFGRQVILDVAVTAVDGQSRTSDDVADRPLNVRYDQKMAKYHRLADQSGFHFVPAVFSHTGQFHKSIKRLIAEQIRNKLAFSEGVVKQSRVRSTMRWWTKCISMVIAKTASRNVAFKTNVMCQAVLEAQSSFVMPETMDQEASSQKCSLNDGDVVRNVDLYVFNHEVVNG